MRQTNPEKIVIIGAGQAAAQTVQSLRQGGYSGALTIVGEEKALPYQRPPLSKAYMKGELEEERLYFKPSSWYQEQSIDLRLGQRAVSIDRHACTVQLQRSAPIAFDVLIFATGSRPRSLTVPGASLENVYDLRTLDDVERIRPFMVAGRRLVVIGAGYIGLEAAAVARQLGVDVTVVEMAPRVLARVTGEVLSRFYEDEHRRQGVNILTGAELSHLDGTNGKVVAATLKDGRSLPADMVLAGIGIVPNIELASAAGIACSDGILVDRDGRTTAENVFAAGDCANRPLVHYGRSGRLESVHNAIEQGKLIAAAILGHERPIEDCPWFWSDQYDLKLQIAGLSAGFDHYVVRGVPESRKLAVFYFRGEQLVAADAVNSAPEFLAAKKLISSGATPPPELLRDPAVPMKDLLLRQAR